ncbi:MAG: hypothetical protein J5938_00405, partial [Clostridia bacterium]|nr:hypothetical protein [Clostridia bacterium]
RITNQGDSLAKMTVLYQGTGINFVNVYDTFFAHRSEYLYLKTDHHWNGRGAYYAYTVFAKSLGLSPASLDSLSYTVLNSKYHGSLYSFTQDPRVLQFSDVLEAFDPGVPCTMTITRTGGSTETYKSSIITAYGNYLAYIGGDNPYTIINVPSNPQDKSILVLKDSYGNAIIPYLTLHYGNIIIIDPRYCGFNIYQQFKDYGLDDILFLNNMQCVNTSTWIRLYLALVGVS